MIRDDRFFSLVYQTTITTFIEFGQGLDWEKTSVVILMICLEEGQNYSSSYSFGALLGVTTAPLNTVFEPTGIFYPSFFSRECDESI